jgi:hypothetical protein
MQDWMQNIISNMKLTEYCVGAVRQLNPLKIDFGDGKVITDVGTNILFTEQVLEKKIELKHNHKLSNLPYAQGDTPIILNESDSTSDNLVTYTINEGLKPDDKLLMLRVANGQKWIVISKLRDKNKLIINSDNSWNWS